MNGSNDSSSRARQDRAAKIRLLVAEEIKVTRLELGFTQVQLAEISGLSQTLVSKMERGKCLTLDNLSVVAMALDVPIARLLSRL